MSVRMTRRYATLLTLADAGRALVRGAETDRMLAGGWVRYERHPSGNGDIAVLVTDEGWKALEEYDRAHP